MKKQLFFVSLLTLFATSAHSMNKQGYDEQEAWGPEEYDKNSQGQLQAGIEMLAEEQIPPNATVVDFGCGTGNLAAHIATKIVPQGRVIGFDIDRNMIDYAKTKHDMIPNLEFRHNFFGVLQENSVDCIISIYCLSWIKEFDNITAVMKEAARCLKPGGQFVARFSIKHSDEHPLPFFRSVDEVIDEGRWWPFYRGAVPLVNSFDVQDYARAMLDGGLYGRVFVVELPEYPCSRELIEDRLMSLPTGRMIPKPCRPKFFDDILESLEKYAQKNAKGDFLLVGKDCIIKAQKQI